MHKDRERYCTDPKYKMAVDVMQGMLEDSILTTEGLARAAVLAAQIYAERHGTITTIKIEKKNDDYEDEKKFF